MKMLAQILSSDPDHAVAWAAQLSKQAAATVAKPLIAVMVDSTEDPLRRMRAAYAINALPAAQSWPDVSTIYESLPSLLAEPDPDVRQAALVAACSVLQRTSKSSIQRIRTDDRLRPLRDLIAETELTWEKSLLQNLFQEWEPPPGVVLLESRKDAAAFQAMIVAGSRYVVLIADSSPRLRRIIQQSLDQKEFDVHFSASAAEALETIKLDMPHLVVMDMNMPDIERIDFEHALSGSSSRRNKPIIIESAAILAQATSLSYTDVVNGAQKDLVASFVREAVHAVIK